MRVEDIIKALENRGYKAEITTTIKNGVELDGIIIKQGRISPVIYIEKIIKAANSIEEVVEKIIALSESAKGTSFEVETILSKEYIMDNCYIAFQKSSTEELIKRDTDFEGIEQYLYIKGFEKEDAFNIKLNSQLLAKANISEKEIWEVALNHTIQAATICNIAELLFGDVGLDIDLGLPIYVVSNKDKTRGAAAILNKKMLSEFATSKGVKKLFVLPSSIHEMLIIPYSEEFILDNLSEMVKEVNGNKVIEEEQLTNQAYVWNV